MKIIEINIDQKSYKIVQIRPTINLYKILHLDGSFEVTRNNYSGTWKILMQNNKSAKLPLQKIGRAIEERLGVGNQQFA